jgi:hypothetical protein
VIKQGTFFEVDSARDFHESVSQQQEALRILRVRKLTKRSFERDWPGSRLAPAIDVLKNGWGFEIMGHGTQLDPYWLVNPQQSPTKVRTTQKLQDSYYETDHWKSKRQERYEFDNHRCVLCVGSCREKLQCHHITYNLFGESLDELMTVCECHHKLIHDACKLKFPTGVETWVAERLLGIVAYPFEEWLLP